MIPSAGWLPTAAKQLLESIPSRITPVRRARDRMVLRIHTVTKSFDNSYSIFKYLYNGHKPLCRYGIDLVISPIQWVATPILIQRLQALASYPRLLASTFTSVPDFSQVNAIQIAIIF